MKSTGSVWALILIAGFVAGTIDLGAAILITGAKPEVIFHFIASGLIGKAASFGGGTSTAALGVVLQWAMSWIIAAVYVLASLRLDVLRRLWLPLGLAYGMGVFAVMNYVVVPLSQVRKIPHFSPTSFAENMAAMLLFGLIIAAFAGRRPAPALA
jgi:hypothetical protein